MLAAAKGVCEEIGRPDHRQWREVAMGVSDAHASAEICLYEKGVPMKCEKANAVD